MDTFLDEIRRGPRAAVGERVHVRRTPVEIRTAIHALGLVHGLDGRPIPGRESPNRHDAVDAVVDYIASNRYARGVLIDRQEVEKQLQREYFSVTPWPFSALVS